jgi:hypothetical protein
MRWGWIALVFAGAACNQVLGIHGTRLVDSPVAVDADMRPDLDHDGIPDPIDPCIAAQADGVEDHDGDGIVNQDDGCPALNPNGPDSDGDGVPDACDPFPALPGDRHRCTMRFLDADLNSALWQPRTGSPAWMLTMPGMLAGGFAPSSIVAVETIEAPATTAYDVQGRFSTTSTLPTEIGLWLRAGDAPDPSDVGCVLVASTSTSYFHLELRGAGVNVASTPATAQDGAIGMTAVLEPTASGANVRCYAWIVWFDGVDDVARSYGPIATAVALPAGQVGFSVNNAGVAIDILTVYDRDDSPPLP